MYGALKTNHGYSKIASVGCMEMNTSSIIELPLIVVCFHATAQYFPPRIKCPPPTLLPTP